jgi:hypothetical protein
MHTGLPAGNGAALQKIVRRVPDQIEGRHDPG